MQNETIPRNRPRSAGPPKRAENAVTSRRVSFWALAAAATGIGVLFFKLIAPFFASLFLAVVFAMLLFPYHGWLAARLGGRHRVAALLTVVLLLGVLVGMSTILLFSGRELVSAGEQLARVDLANNPTIVRLGTAVNSLFPGIELADVRKSAESAVETFAAETVRRTGSYVSNLVGVVVGAAILALALYYFLAEGPAILRSLRAISPFDQDDEWKLFRKFAAVSRGVVIGIFVCAFVQAALLGVGLAVVGIQRVWMLTGLTLLLSMIPFVGAAGVWAPVSAWLLWQGQITQGLLLALYGAVIVSTSDNLIRAYVLHESAKMHPLLALVSALGALQVVGLWGIFLGPVVAAYFYSILRILHERLRSEKAPQPVTALPPPERSPSRGEPSPAPAGEAGPV